VSSVVVITQFKTKSEGVKELRRLVVRYASGTDGEVFESQRLRHKVFAEEMGAQLDTTVPGLDHDKSDDFCEHLVVVDSKTSEVVATTRLITNESAIKSGGFYSETEFDLSNILGNGYQFLEVGRTCVDAQYRSTTAINHLWKGVARAAVKRKVDYLFGCVSIPMNDGGEYITTLMNYLRGKYWSEDALRVTPRKQVSYVDLPAQVNVVIPSLLKRYLNLGAVVCGEPCYDRDFNVADIFVIVDATKINQRYERHFFNGA